MDWNVISAAISVGTLFLSASGAWSFYRWVQHRIDTAADEREERIDHWHKAISFLTWREHVLRQEPVGLRVGIVEMMDKGSSRTTYIEPGDVVTGVQKSES